MFPESLTKGYRSFIGGRLSQERKKYEELGKGQSPEVLLISCCDSRVAPEVIFDAGPGEIFTLRNVAAIVPPYETAGQYHGTSAALEFAVQALKVKHIVVLGHASCGGIKAYAGAYNGASGDPLSPGDFIGKWVSLVEPAANALTVKGFKGDEPEYQTRLEQAMVSQSLANLMSFPFVRERVRGGELQVHGAHFGIATGELTVCDRQTGAFHPAVDGDGVSLTPAALIHCSEPGA